MRPSANYAKTRITSRKLKALCVGEKWNRHQCEDKASHCFHPPSHRDLFLIGSLQRQWSVVWFWCRSRGGGVIPPAHDPSNPSSLSDQQPHCQSYAEEEATRMWNAGILFCRSASVIRILHRFRGEGFNSFAFFFVWLPVRRTCLFQPFLRDLGHDHIAHRLCPEK